MFNKLSGGWQWGKVNGEGQLIFIGREAREKEEFVVLLCFSTIAPISSSSLQMVFKIQDSKK